MHSQGTVVLGLLFALKKNVIHKIRARHGNNLITTKNDTESKNHLGKCALHFSYYINNSLWALFCVSMIYCAISNIHSNFY